MRSPRKLLVPRSWLRLPRRTARTRLSLLYAGLFLLTGVCVLTLVYLVTSTSSPIHISVSASPVGRVVTIHRKGNSVFVYPQGSTTPTVPAVPPVPTVPPVPVGARGTRVVKNLVSAQHTADVSRLLAVSWLGLAITTLLSALFGWIAAGRVLRPLRTITTTAQSISAGNLHERLALAGPNDEFRQLGDTLDDLLGRLEASFEAQRRFVANASHELRTPLTLERTLLQVALADPNATVESLRATCEELLASGQDQERLLEGLLTLASSERGLERRELLDLSRIAEHVLSTARPEAERLSVHIEASLAPASTRGDRGLIERLVANLTDNAIRYNHPDGRIDIHTATDADRALLTVTNTGPAIASKDVDRLFEPFQRLGEDRTADDGGHGLGLSIARAIAAAHDAIITARPQPEGGLEVTVSFPGA
jgi:signal transduction histidine kinase